MEITLEPLNKLIKSEKAIPSKKKIKQTINRGDATVILYLINNGLLNPNATVEDGNTPLHVACDSGHDSIVKLLIDKGAKIDILNNSGKSPFYLACQHGHDSIVEFLIKKDVNVDMPDKWGKTPLHWACFYEHSSIVKLLIEKGANINILDNDRICPLYVACVYRYSFITDFLLKKGAWITKRLKEHFLPMLNLDYCIQQTLFFLYCIRKSNPDSVFGANYLPRDMFKLIIHFYISKEKIDDLYENDDE